MVPYGGGPSSYLYFSRLRGRSRSMSINTDHEVPERKMSAARNSSSDHEVPETKMSSSSSSRSILCLGKVAVGKSSIANHILGETAFPVEHSMASVSRAPREHLQSRSCHINGRQCSVYLMDTVGQYERRSGINLTSDLEIHLALFVVQKGLPTKAEIEAFESILSHGPKTLKDISALVITFCETLDQTARQELIDQYKSHPLTQGVAASMGKGIYTVGFPHPEEIHGNVHVRQVYEDSMACDERQLHRLIDECTVKLNLTQSSQRRSFVSCVLS